MKKANIKTAGRYAGAAKIFLSLACLAGWFGAAQAGEAVVNGTFESGSFGGSWVHNGANSAGSTNPSWADHTVALDMPYGGSYSALLGFKYTTQRANRNGFMYQTVTIPADISSARLFFRFRQQGYDGVNYDPFVVTVRNTSNAVLATLVNYSFSEWNNQFKDSGWIENDGSGPEGIDMTPWAGRTIRIHFRQENTYDNLYETWAFVDDVSLVYKKFVDLAADGNGEDLFGAPGTGAGGYSEQSGEAGETVSYLVDVENEGFDVDSYTLSVSPPPGWNVALNYGGTDHSFPWVTPAVAGGSRITVRVDMTIPSGQALGSYNAILDAVSTAFGTRFDSARLTAYVVPSDHLVDLAIDSNGFGIIDPDGAGGVSYREASPGATIDYQIELLNGGLIEDAFFISFAPAAPLSAVILDGGVPHGGSFTTGIIQPGNTASFTLRVTVPASLQGGDYASYVYARSLADVLRVDGVRAVTRVIAPKVDIVIAGSGDGIIDMTSSGLGGNGTISGQRGNTVYFPIIIQNEGAVQDSFLLSWVRPSPGWTAVMNDGTADHPLPWTTAGFEPFEQRNFTLAITIPSNAAFDTYTSRLNASSRVDAAITESVTAGVSVASGNETDLMIDGNGADTYGPLGTGLGGSSLAYAAPGDTVFFSITVENEGGANTFDIEWDTPVGWVVLFDGMTSPVSTASGNYTLEVRIPATCAGGTFDIIVDGMKSNKRYFVDSVRGTVVVSRPRIVDALIDGVGDELFGTPGLGGGGSSSQSTIAGRTVNFTIELQNQGSEAEAYVVDWNDFGGWAAFFGGEAGPCTTSAVSAGASLLSSFQVVVPSAAAPGDYAYIIDIVSVDDPGNVESVTANIHVNPPPMVDLVIDGAGAFDTAPAGSGEGGRTIVFGAPGVVVTAALEVFNRGGAADSFRIEWAVPAGWPAGSVLLSSGGIDHGSPFATPLIDPGNSLVFTVTIAVPASAALRSSFIIDGTGLSMPLEDSVLLEIVTAAFIRARVFEDLDHDGLPGALEPGIGGVSIAVTDPSAPLSGTTGAGGEILFEVVSGAARDVIETTPSGMFSLSPDTVSAGPGVAGDTLFVWFADVFLSSITPTLNANGPAGGFIELAHTITAGTAGQAFVAAALPPGWADVWYRDVNGDGIFDPSDTPLTTGDLDLDPSIPGRDVVPVVVRVFIPPTVAAGTTGTAVITLYQTLGGTAIETASSVTDQLLVLGSSSGILRLVKEVDLAGARPGDVVTYTIIFSNPGAEDVVEIEIIDPVSAAVDLVVGAFGPGSDIEWIRSGSSVYLTADPLDADEAMFDPASGTLRVQLSRQAPFNLAPGTEGRIVYRVRVR